MVSRKYIYGGGWSPTKQNIMNVQTLLSWNFMLIRLGLGVYIGIQAFETQVYSLVFLLSCLSGRYKYWLLCSEWLRHTKKNNSDNTEDVEYEEITSSNSIENHQFI
jgi:hypothetical protein